LASGTPDALALLLSLGGVPLLVFAVWVRRTTYYSAKLRRAVRAPRWEAWDYQMLRGRAVRGTAPFAPPSRGALLTKAGARGERVVAGFVSLGLFDSYRLGEHVRGTMYLAGDPRVFALAWDPKQRFPLVVCSPTAHKKSLGRQAADVRRLALKGPSSSDRNRGALWTSLS